jgi:hypothetical protein
MGHVCVVWKEVHVEVARLKAGWKLVRWGRKAVSAVITWRYYRNYDTQF